MNKCDSVSQGKGSDQRLVVVAGKDSRAVVSFQTREGNVWRVHRNSMGWIGCHGLGKKEEGDGRTPAGSLSFLYAFGTEPSPGTSFPYRHIDESHYLVDDSSSCYYNQIVSVRDVVADWRSAEHMTAMQDAYHYGIATDYNKDRVPGLGSGIFLHCEQGRPTAGCISVPKEMMAWLLRNMSPECRLLLVLDFPQGKCYT